MKANEAPEKIYIRVKNGKTFNTWNSEWIGVNDVEYTRTDAFIEKAAKWINEHTSLSEKLVIENFRNYMKGE